MKFLRILILTLVVLTAGNLTLNAGEAVKKPLDQAFQETVIIPFDYQNKVFLNGEKTDVFGDYELYERNGRVLVPIRMMSYLAGELGQNEGYWQVNWDAQAPDDVILVNYQQQKTIKLKVNSKTMYVNHDPVILDVPPQNINGRVVLPLRGVAEALDKKVAWQDRLVILSAAEIDLKNPKTLAVKDKIKARLADARKEVNYEKRVRPVAKYHNTLYYVKTTYLKTGALEELYSKTGSNPEVKIDLPGNEKLAHSQVINNKLYYVSKVDGKSELHIFDFAGNESSKICDFGDWNPEDGWLGNIKYIGQDLYIILHSGDLTMGSESLYKLEGGSLKKVAGAKTFTGFDVAGDDLYYIDFHPMINWAGNLFRVNLITGEKVNLGDKEYTYGILRESHDNGGVSYSYGSMYLFDGNIYTLGHQESDPQDLSAVYKISLDGTGHQKLSPPARKFWLVDEKIYYTDFHTGSLVQIDLTGNNQKTVVEKPVLSVKFLNENIYYTVAGSVSTRARLGKLYKYNISAGQEIPLSDQPVSEFFPGPVNTYYTAEGYDLGLYKIDAGGRTSCLVDDSLYSTLYTGEGIVYTLRYEDGIFFAN
jgi:hypothetical protein